MTKSRNKKSVEYHARLLGKLEAICSLENMAEYLKGPYANLDTSNGGGRKGGGSWGFFQIFFEFLKHLYAVLVNFVMNNCEMKAFFPVSSSVPSLFLPSLFLPPFFPAGRRAHASYAPLPLDLPMKVTFALHFTWCFYYHHYNHCYFLSVTNSSLTSYFLSIPQNNPEKISAGG